LIENIPLKEKERGYPMLQISLTLIVKMITGLEDLHELENEIEEDPLLKMFCTIESKGTPSVSTLDRDLDRYSVNSLQDSYKQIKVFDYIKKEHKRGYKIFAIYDPTGILIEFTLCPINKGDNPNLIPLIERAREILGESTIKKVFFDRGFYDGKHFDWLNKKNIMFVCRGKQGTKVAEQVSEISEEQYIEEKLLAPNEYLQKKSLMSIEIAGA
jgi:hypothetical protein